MLEYAENGSLQSFLRKHCPGTKKIHEKYINLANQEIKEKDLIRWSYEIAKGMEFLALKMVYLYKIDRDLYIKCPILNF